MKPTIKHCALCSSSSSSSLFLSFTCSVAREKDETVNAKIKRCAGVSPDDETTRRHVRRAVIRNTNVFVQRLILKCSTACFFFLFYFSFFFFSQPQVRAAPPPADTENQHCCVNTQNILCNQETFYSISSILFIGRWPQHGLNGGPRPRCFLC